MTEPVIEIRQLSRQFGSKTALDNVSLTVARGGVFGLVGENGAGKTTLLKHLLGLLRAPSGAVRVFGMDPAQSPEQVLSRIGFLSEDRDLPAWMRIDQLMRYRRSFYPDWDDAYATDLVRQFDLRVDQKVRTLSRGQLARVGLLLAVAHRPELLILDEPSSGLDPVVRRDILSAIIRTVADEGRTVLFSSHLLDEVQRVSDHVAMLHHGLLLLSDSLESVLTSHSRCTFRLPEDGAQPAEIPGAISWTGDGREWSAVCNGQRPEFDAWLKSQGAEVLDENPPSLEDIFVARAGRSVAGDLS